MIKIQHNVETNVIEEIPFNNTEIAEVESEAIKSQKAKDDLQKQADAKAAEKSAVLTKLGLTSEEVAALLS